MTAAAESHSPVAPAGANLALDGEAFIARAFRQAMTAMAIFDLHGRALQVNDAFCRLLGYSDAEVHAGAALDFTHQDDLEASRTLIARLLSGESTSARLEKRYRRRDGSVLWGQLWLSLIRSEDGAPLCFSAQVDDITEQRAIERALRASEAKNQAIFDASPDTFIRIRRDGTILDVKGDTSAWRTPPDHTVGRSLAQLMPSDMAAPALESIGEAVTSGQMQSYEFETPSAQGTRCLEARIVACGEDEALCSLRDITARRRAEHEARQRLTELAHVARVSNMGEMAAALAHELNQPLTAIVNYASGCNLRVEAGTIESGELRAVLRQVSQQAVRAAEILRRLRDFIRKAPPQRARVDLNELAREVAGLADLEARAHAVTLRLELDPTIPAVSADGIQIEQVMLNLIRNGIEAMADAAAPRILTVRTSHAPAARVAVTVSDRGRGLARNMDIFEPFVSTKPQGLGLGLSISRSIVEAHGGGLSGWSDEQPSTTFEFTLPVARGGSR